MKDDVDLDDVRKNKILIRKANLLENPLEESGCPKEFICAKDSSMICHVRHYRIQFVPKELMNWIVDCLTQNMKPLYSLCSKGWNLPKYMKQLTAKWAQYLFIFVNDKPVAFSQFRFDMDFDRAVLYCYELQVDSSYKSKGLGTQLMRILESIAKSCKIPFVVLTTLKNNPGATRFYKRLGYEKDETNLEGVREYLILSKHMS